MSTIPKQIITPKDIDVEKRHSDYNALYSQKQTLQTAYKSAEKEAVGLKRELSNLNQYHDWNAERRIVGGKNDKSQWLWVMRRGLWRWGCRKNMLKSTTDL